MGCKIDLERVYRPRSRDDLREVYDRWADGYDAQVTDDFGYVGHEIMADFLAPHLKPEDRILDAGAGSGLAGEALARRGFANIDACDLSVGMLDRARARGVYRDVRTGVLGERLDYDDDAYDAALVCGVFTPGHAPPSSFRELLRVVRPGGSIAFTLRHDETPPGFVETIDELTASGAWERVALGDPVRIMPRENAGILHRYWLFRAA